MLQRRRLVSSVAVDVAIFATCVLAVLVKVTGIQFFWEGLHSNKENTKQVKWLKRK